MNHDIPRYTERPDVLKISPDVLMVSPDVLNTHYTGCTLRPESILVRRMFTYRISTTETANLVFVLLDNDLIAGNY